MVKLADEVGESLRSDRSLVQENIQLNIITAITSEVVVARVTKVDGYKLKVLEKN